MVISTKQKFLRRNLQIIAYLEMINLEFLKIIILIINHNYRHRYKIKVIALKIILTIWARIIMLKESFIDKQELHPNIFNFY